jgi:hypothetical protein
VRNASMYGAPDTDEAVLPSGPIVVAQDYPRGIRAGISVTLAPRQWEYLDPPHSTGRTGARR